MFVGVLGYLSSVYQTSVNVKGARLEKLAGTASCIAGKCSPRWKSDVAAAFLVHSRIRHSDKKQIVTFESK